MGFVDVYGFDDELLAMVPSPVLAVLFLFPLTKEVCKRSSVSMLCRVFFELTQV